MGGRLPTRGAEQRPRCFFALVINHKDTGKVYSCSKRAASQSERRREIPLSLSLLQGYFWERWEKFLAPWSCSSKAQELRLPNEGGEIFLLSSSQHGRASAGRSLSHMPLLPPLLKPAWPKPLNICRAAPLAPHLLFRQTFPPGSGSPAAPVVFFQQPPPPPSQPAEHLRSHVLPPPDTAGAGGAATSTRLFSCKTQDLGDTMLKLLFNSSRNLHRTLGLAGGGRPNSTEPGRKS